MTIEERLHHDELDPVLPGLAPPPDLAGTVLRRVRRRRLRAPVLVAAALTAAAVAVPVAGLGPGGGGSPAAPPTPTDAVPAPTGPAPTRLPALGGGPRTLHAFTSADTGRTSVLDVRTGRYRELPYETVLLSPDLRRLAVSDGDRIGIADRARLLADGGRAVTWTTVPVGPGLAWSPDGTALLSDVLAKDGGAVTHTVLRYQLRTGQVTSTPVPAGIQLIGTAAWAANSRDYLLLPVVAETAGTVTPGPLRTLHPDGHLGPTAATGGPLLLLVVDARTGRTVRSVRLPGVPALADVELGPSKGVSDTAPRF